MKHCLFILILSFLLLSCNGGTQSSSNDTHKKETEDTIRGFDKIKQRGEIIALTANSSSSYFIYKGQTLGYEYELLKNLSEYLNIGLRIKIVNNIDSILYMLNRGEGDIAAYTITVTNERKQLVDFTENLFISEQTLIQKKPDDWYGLPKYKVDNQLVRNVLELENQEVYVRKNSSYYERLVNLSNEMGVFIDIKEVEGNVTTEDLIDQVAKGEIPFTVADREIAQNYCTYNNIVDYRTAISLPQQMAWAVPKNSPELLDTIDAWLSHFKKYKKYYFIYDKYFNNPKRTRRIAKSSYYSFLNSQLSPFDDYIKEGAETINWDWRLLASQIYQESRFDAQETSWMGALGLMQVLPTTADMYGEYNLHIPEQNILAGTLHLKRIIKKFEYLDSINQIKFTLASYNVGLGHIYDAIRLAKRFDKDTAVWDDNVAEMLLLKSKPQFYKLEESRNGYCRGREPYEYVSEIFSRYEDYKQLIK